MVTCGDSGYLENEIKPLISGLLSERGLELSREKTKITHIRKGFDFLGFNIRKYGDKCLTKLMKDSVKSIMESIGGAAASHKSVTQADLIRMISPKIRGWANYFRHSAASGTFALLDHKVFRLLWKWAKRRHPKKGSRWVRAKYFRTKGNRNWVFAAGEKGKTFELPLFEASKIRRHVKIRNNSNPYDREWDGYFKERTARRRVYQNTSMKAS
ncbi:group II intron maturase-specific domain-containing protein [Lunatibacter salilacus]|uniref:group II intron maturase-specific domain-containing protein n=1 Tax=Lunatibacter salilacus TaxID=2483804 RepID=UPI00131B029C|nr:group II intron maturase-specific domain-containing protein [Lunatibacter salilacus]